MGKRALIAGLASIALFVPLAAAPSASAATSRKTFTTGVALDITDDAPATTYPVDISVHFRSRRARIKDVNVTIDGFSHQYGGDVDILLVSPGGRQALLFSDAGQENTPVGPLNIVLDDQARNPLPYDSHLSSGRFRPENYDGTTSDFFPSPGPSIAPNHGPKLAVFHHARPNGDWTVWIVDDSSTDSGDIHGSIALTITAG